MVIRHYNEEKDKFEKVCSVKNGDYCFIAGKMLIASGEVYYNYEGKLFQLGKEEDFFSVLTDELKCIDVSSRSLPFKFLFIYKNKIIDEAISFKKNDRSVILEASSLKWEVTYSLQQSKQISDGKETYDLLKRHS